MKRARLWFVLVLIAASRPGIAESENEEETTGERNGPAYSVDYERSTLHWEGSKPGGTHHGRVEVVTGTAVTDGETVTGGTFVIDMRTIRNDDITGGGMRKRLVDHLKSEDFFYVEKYPDARFTITKVEPVAGLSMGDAGEASHMVTGDLTVRGNTGRISFPAYISMDEKTIHARTGKIALDRTRWEVNHMSKSVVAGLKDRFINDEMIVRLDIHFSRN